MLERSTSLVGWVSNAVVLFVAAVLPHLGAVMYVIGMAVLLVACDLVTGVAASHKRGEAIVSGGLRRTVGKVVIYALFVVLTLLVGVVVHLIDGDVQMMRSTLLLVRVQAFLIVWIEGVSNVENLMVLFPRNRFLAVVHRGLATEFVKWLPKLWR